MNNNYVEGFTANSNTDRENISEAIRTESNKQSDRLLIDKYRNAYEDTIINLENMIGLTLLSETINNAEMISKNPISKESLVAISNINNLKQFKETLNDAMQILDKAK
jgi:hypothetical protein